MRGEGDPYLGADAFLRHQRYGSLILIHNPLDNGQTDPLPASKAGIKRLKNHIPLLLRHPDPRIPELEMDSPLRAFFHIDGENSSFGHGLYGIFDDVPKQLLELVGASIIRNPGVLIIPPQLNHIRNISAALKEQQGFLQDISQINGIYNLVKDVYSFLKADGSKGAHNAAYSRSLLKDAMNRLNYAYLVLGQAYTSGS